MGRAIDQQRPAAACQQQRDPGAALLQCAVRPAERPRWRLLRDAAGSRKTLRASHLVQQHEQHEQQQQRRADRGRQWARRAAHGGHCSRGRGRAPALLLGSNAITLTRQQQRAPPAPAALRVQQQRHAAARQLAAAAASEHRVGQRLALPAGPLPPAPRLAHHGARRRHRHAAAKGQHAGGGPGRRRAQRRRGVGGQQRLHPHRRPQGELSPLPLPHTHAQCDTPAPPRAEQP